MGQYTYNDIKNRIFEWSQKEIYQYLSEHDKVELSKNNDEALIIDFTFRNCLAQLTVSQPYFAPCQFVFFEAATLDSVKAQISGEPEMIYFFYDLAEMSEKDVINGLGIGIQHCSNYMPN